MSDRLVHHAHGEAGHSCHADDAHAQQGPAHHHGSSWLLAAHSTLHCLTGCVIGEVMGLAIGVSLGLPAWQTIVLATLLAYVSGIALGVLPVMRDRSLGFLPALKIIWIGEVISIGVMELAMNFADYHMGGMNAGTIFSWMFVRALLVAVPAGFLAAWPINYWLLKRNLKACH